MSTRETAVTTAVSGTNKTYPAGGASAPSVTTIFNIALTKDADKSTNSLLAKNGAFNGHAVEVWADGAVFDTVSGTYLLPGRDFNPGDIQRK